MGEPSRYTDRRGRLLVLSVVRWRRITRRAPPRRGPMDAALDEESLGVLVRRLSDRAWRNEPGARAVGDARVGDESRRREGADRRKRWRLRCVDRSARTGGAASPGPRDPRARGRGDGGDGAAVTTRRFAAPGVTI